MTDIAVTEAPAPKRKRRKQAKRRAAPKPAAQKIEFAGLTAAECCADCTPERCVISVTNVCVHPYKGGMQSAMMQNRAVLERYNRARKKLAHQKVDLRAG